MNYSWLIQKLVTRTEQSSDSAELSDAVVQVHWKRIGINDDGDSASINGYTTLSTAEVASADFVAFNDLTEEVVINWLNTVNSSSTIDDYNSKIDGKLRGVDEIIRAVPWS